MTGRFRVLALLLTAATLQATVFDALRIDGVSVEYLLLVAVLAGASALGALFGLHPVDGSTLLGTSLLAAAMTGVVAAPTSRIVGWAVTGGLPVDIDVDSKEAAGGRRTPVGRGGRR